MVFHSRGSISVRPRFGVGAPAGAALLDTRTISQLRCACLPLSIDRWLSRESGLVSYLDRVTVDHDGKVPVYLQLAAILRAQIAAGQYAPGRAIPSESRLMQEHGLARETVRKAVRVLAAEGLVEVVRGRGVYVNDPPS
jgi:GntR family transcriptional regulator